MAFASCSKKTVPTKTDFPKEDSETVVKPTPPKKEPSNLFPKVIIVNDAAAQKSVDGRLYYDLKDHRYWKNYRDGKYYLFNKSIYKNPDFQPPKGK